MGEWVWEEIVIFQIIQRLDIHVWWCIDVQLLARWKIYNVSDIFLLYRIYSNIKDWCTSMWTGVLIIGVDTVSTKPTNWPWLRAPTPCFVSRGEMVYTVFSFCTIKISYKDHLKLRPSPLLRPVSMKMCLINETCSLLRPLSTSFIGGSY